MSFEDNMDKIEQYLSGNLSEAEKAAFEKEIAENAELREEVELLRILPKAIQLHEEKKIREQLQDLERTIRGEEIADVAAGRAAASVPPPSGVSGGGWFKYTAVAASLLLLVGLFFLLKDGGNDTSNIIAQTDKKDIRVNAKELTINTLKDESFGFIADTTARKIVVVACKPAGKDSLGDVVYYKLSHDTLFVLTANGLMPDKFFTVDTRDLKGDYLQLASSYYKIGADTIYKPTVNIINESDIKLLDSLNFLKH